MPYRIEYATTARASCKGPKPCAGTKIEKGALRLGSLTEIQGHTHSTTSRVLANMRKDVEDVTQDLDGYEDLREEDKEQVLAAFALGHLREEDVTPCLREGGEGSTGIEASSSKTSGAKRRRKDDDQHDDDNDDDNDDGPAEQSDGDDDVAPTPDFVESLPAKRARRTPVRYDAAAARSVRTTKTKKKDKDGEDDSDEEEEDEKDAASGMSDEDDEDDEDDSESEASDNYKLSDHDDDDDDDDRRP